MLTDTHQSRPRFIWQSVSVLAGVCGIPEVGAAMAPNRKGKRSGRIIVVDRERIFTSVGDLDDRSVLLPF